MASNHNGTTDKLRLASIPVAVPPYTYACWARGTSITSRTLIGAGNNGANRQAKLWVNGSGNLVAETFDGATTGTSGSAGAFPSDQWAHCAAVFAATNNRIAYLNGSAGTANTTNLTPTLEAMHVGLLGTGILGDVQFWAGDIAEAAIWNVALDAGEITALAKGYAPSLIRPASLVFYVPLIRSKEPIIGPTLTVTGTTVSDHPRVLMAS